MNLSGSPRPMSTLHSRLLPWQREALDESLRLSRADARTILSIAAGSSLDRASVPPRRPCRRVRPRAAGGVDVDETSASAARAPVAVASVALDPQVRTRRRQARSRSSAVTTRAKLLVSKVAAAGGNRRRVAEAELVRPVVRARPRASPRTHVGGAEGGDQADQHRQRAHLQLRQDLLAAFPVGGLVEQPGLARAGRAGAAARRVLASARRLARLGGRRRERDRRRGPSTSSPARRPGDHARGVPAEAGYPKSISGAITAAMISKPGRVSSSSRSTIPSTTPATTATTASRQSMTQPRARAAMPSR